MGLTPLQPEPTYRENVEGLFMVVFPGFLWLHFFFMAQKQGWIGVDLDGTLALYDEWRGIHHIGAPVPLMLERVHAWIVGGRDVRIFTARVYRMLYPEGTPEREEGIQVVANIHAWLIAQGLPALPVTCFKDFGMVELWDDRCVQVVPNTGERADGKERA